jgi:hypothetical protein
MIDELNRALVDKSFEQCTIPAHPSTSVGLTITRPSLAVL